MAHGSGRSIPGFHLLNALNQCRELFTRFGGHASAAGFSLPCSLISQLEIQFERNAQATLTPSDLEPVLHIDAQVRLAELTAEMYGHLKRLEPFGYCNPPPVFAAQVSLASPPRVLKEKHLKIRVSQSGRSLDAIGWRLGAEAPKLAGKELAEIAFSLGQDNFQGKADLQLLLRHIRPLPASEERDHPGGGLPSSA